VSNGTLNLAQPTNYCVQLALLYETVIGT